MGTISALFSIGTNVVVSALDGGIGDEFGGNAGQGLFPRGIDRRQEEAVTREKGVSELHVEIPGTGIQMGLEQGDDAAFGAVLGNIEGGGDLGAQEMTDTATRLRGDTLTSVTVKKLSLAT